MTNRTGCTYAGAFSLTLAAISAAIAAYGLGAGWEATRFAGPSIGALALLLNGYAQLYLAATAKD